MVDRFIWWTGLFMDNIRFIFMYRLTWILLCSVVLIVGCQKISQRLTNPAQDKFIQVYFNHQVNTSSYTDPYRQIEKTGDNLEQVIIDEIAAAKSTIDLAVQELNLPLVAQALAKSQQAGIKVRVILENNYSRPLSELNKREIKSLNQRDRQKYEQFQQLVDLNGDGYLSDQEISQSDALVILNNAEIPIIDDTADGSKGSGLMHHKFMVVDGQTVITGSANFTLSDVHGDVDNLDTKGNVNHLFRIENKELADIFTEEFNYMWEDNKFGLDKPWRSPRSLNWENTEVTIQFSPISNSKDWHLSGNGLIGETLNKAEDSIDLALFVFSEQELADILQEKQQQGLIIQGIFDPGFAFRYYSEVLDMLGVTAYNRCQPETDNNPWNQPLNTIGVPNLAFGDKLHHKFALIDDQTIISGSHNWSQAANHLNDETLIVINNHQVAQHFDQEFQRLYQSAFLGLPQQVQSKLEQQQQKCK
jgi:phosphatidylserine/phosphatidylglycerophosphate/cardiolipin synthase-like enzyme